MKKRTVLMLTAVAVQFIISCTAPKIQTTTASTPDNKLLFMLGPIWGTFYQQQAAEYKALTVQAYNVARYKLDEYLQQQTDKPFAVITDIDETVLDNSPNAVHDALLGKTYSDSSWQAWTAREAADTVPGAPAFFKYAASKGVQVFYISNRKAEELTHTMANLNKYGFPFVDAAHILLKTTTSNKDERRALVAVNYNVVLYCGDALGDFKSAFDTTSAAVRNTAVHQYADSFGSRFIVLPNAVYGTWVRALKNYNNVDSMIHGLKTY